MTARRLDNRANVYAVSLHGSEEVFSELPFWQNIRDWLHRHWERFDLPLVVGDELRSPYMGGWRDEQGPDTRYVLDVSVPISDLDETVRVAQAEKQQSIYHVPTGKVIPV